MQLKSLVNHSSSFYIWLGSYNLPNKAFKSDSQRLVFFIPSLSAVFTVVRLSFVVALLTP
ncbi:hypothetical protein D1115_08575 [Vibrio alfacsensis]|uniref:DUF3265 domain-containing protein n=1 Tax=Vibrio alfacsensis TaxID=1074311 RepID=A0ABN5PD87_9VIBR|nr:hypothetical protein D1115_08575 [Vibrio alfacsensis]